MTSYPYPPGHFYNGVIRRRRFARWIYGVCAAVNCVTILLFLMFGQRVSWLNVASLAFIGIVWRHSEHRHSLALATWADDR